MSAPRIATFCLTVLVLSGSHANAANPQMGMSTAASRYFGGNEVVPYQPLRRPAQAPQPVNVTRKDKPFNDVNRQTTLSPYLALDLINDEGAVLPNYYAFYQPQRQEQQDNDAQEATIRRLQQQLRSATATDAISRNPHGGMPTTGTSSQFMNLGGYYPGLR